MSAFCGRDGHPDSCPDCKTRVDAIRALLESSGRCGSQDVPSAVDTVDDDDDSNMDVECSAEPDVGLFCCPKCSDRFDTFSELQKHEQIHAAGKKQCSVCHRHLAAGTSLIAVSSSSDSCSSF